MGSSAVDKSVNLKNWAGNLVRTSCAQIETTDNITFIAPKPGWRGIGFGELWRQRELLYFLVWRDIKVRYKQTVIGAAWAVLQPMATMLLFSVIFGLLAKVSFDGLPYPLAVYAGLLPWMFFAAGVSQSGVSLVNQSHLVTKIYFPRIFVPTACIGASLVDFAIGFVVYAGLMSWYSQLPGIGICILPALLLLTLIATAGLGYLLAGLTVVYRDFRFVISFMMQLGMFLSAAPFPAQLWPQRYHWLLSINPMFGIIKAFRACLLDRAFDWLSLTISAAAAAVIFVVGICYFHRIERRFADIA